MNNKDSPFTFIAPELFQEPWEKTKHILLIMSEHHQCKLLDK